MYLMNSQMGLRGGTTFRVVCAVATAISLLCLPTQLTGSIARTSPPLSFVYLPSTFSEGDIIKIECLLGTTDNEAGPSTSFSFIYDYSDEWFKIDSTSNITANFDDSWACADGNCEADITIDHQAKKIYVTISRLDDELQMGAGVIVRLEGIGVEIDDIHAKLETPKMIFYHSMNKIKVKSHEDILQLTLINMNGQKVFDSEYNSPEIKVSLEALSTGIYSVLVRTKSNVFPMKKKVLIHH